MMCVEFYIDFVEFDFVEKYMEDVYCWYMELGWIFDVEDV